jgi:ABC-type branched-subunit amino acid transport system ATPase component
MRLDGVDVTRQSIHARARSGIARTLQTPHVFNELSVGDNLGLAKGAPSLRERLAGQPDFEVSNAAWSRIFRRHGIVATLPYGAKRLIEIARVQGLNPSVLLLDEPSAGLTAAETSRLADIIRLRADSGCAVVVVEHNLRLVRAVADKVIVLVAGQKISEGSIDDVQANSDVQAAYLGGVVIPTQSGDQA